jgi:hypothetical protein
MHDRERFAMRISESNREVEHLSNQTTTVFQSMLVVRLGGSPSCQVISQDSFYVHCLPKLMLDPLKLLT